MQLIAHRGGGGLRVENTLAAFAHAIDVGAAGAELDVHLTRDGHLVVHHDDCLHPGYCRHPGGAWITPEERQPLADMTLSQLQAYEIGTPRPGSEYARRFCRIQPVTDERIPLLRDVIRLVKARSDTFKLVVEIKTPMLRAGEQPWQALVHATLEVIAAEDFGGRSILCGFDWSALRYVRRQWPALATWLTSVPHSWYQPGRPPASDTPPDDRYLEKLRALYAEDDAPWFAGCDPRRFSGGYPEAVAAAGGDAWFPYYRDVYSSTGSECAGHGLQAAAWSVNVGNAGEAARLEDAGLDFLVTDYPDNAALV